MSQELFSKEQEEFMHEIAHGMQTGATGFKEKVVTLVVGATGLIAALAWDEFLHQLFHQMLHGDTLLAKFVYALVVTLIAVGVSLWLRAVTLAPFEKMKKKFIASLSPNQLSQVSDMIKKYLK